MTVPSDPKRLADLRCELTRRGWDGFVVPRSDEHQGEYVPPRAERLAWLTGFTGSAGLAAVIGEKAAIFVDGRYTLQVRGEVDSALFVPRHLSEEPLSGWIAKELPKGAKFAYDPWLYSENQAAALKEAVVAAGGTLVAAEDNPLDAVWADQPPPPIAPVLPHALQYAGRSSQEKRADLAEGLQQRGIQAVVLSLPDSIAWLLNVRGGDVACTPLPLSFALLHDDGRVSWFVAPEKLSKGLMEHLDNGVSCQLPGDFNAALDGLAGKRVLLDPASAPAVLFQRLTAAGAEVVKGTDPCQLPKAMKNPVELAGTRAAHRRDGAALTRFLAWLDREVSRRAEAGGLSEQEAADTLAAFRREDPLFRDFSFETIAGSGPNGAIVHYRVSPESNRNLGLGELFLCDSGGQYLDGTTDVTRTVAIGTPTAEMRRRFTLVLKGHIALARARFPEGTSGSQLDAFARHALWQEGLDYDHGTGHGVGSYLGVHEGPQRISKLPQAVALKAGMIVSNEPGYYKTGAYGIRIENLVAVTKSDRGEGEERSMLEFETLTLAPIDRRLIEKDLLSGEEEAWLNAYHARVLAAHADVVDEQTKTWLEAATAPL
jgi:Xaa-Pro aminopeptidase